MKPGKHSKSFRLVFDRSWFKAGDIVTTGAGNKAIIEKEYTNAWWKRVLIAIGFKQIHINGFKCKSID